MGADSTGCGRAWSNCRVKKRGCQATPCVLLVRTRMESFGSSCKAVKLPARKGTNGRTSPRRTIGRAVRRRAWRPAVVVRFGLALTVAAYIDFRTANFE